MNYILLFLFKIIQRIPPLAASITGLPPTVYEIHKTVIIFINIISGKKRTKHYDDSVADANEL